MQQCLEAGENSRRAAAGAQQHQKKLSEGQGIIQTGNPVKLALAAWLMKSNVTRWATTIALLAGTAAKRLQRCQKAV